MLRYQPAEQVQNGRLVFLIVDTHTNEILPDWFVSAGERDESMALDNASPEPPRKGPTSMESALYLAADILIYNVFGHANDIQAHDLWFSLVGYPDVPVPTLAGVSLCTFPTSDREHCEAGSFGYCQHCGKDTFAKVAS